MFLSAKLFWKIFSAVLFVLISGLVLFFAYGYRYDFEDQEIQKTSIIDFQHKFVDVQVLVDGAEVISSMPFQFKGVLPGIHEVEVRKDGFYSWSRRVKVVDDRVSIIDDVLLIPENLERFYEEKMVIDGEEEVIFGNGFMLLFSPGIEEMKVVAFGDKAKISIEDIKLFEPAERVLMTHDRQTFLLQFSPVLYAFTDMSEKTVKVFYLPEGVNKIVADRYSDKVYFLLDSALYGVTYGDLAKKVPEDLADFLIAKDVFDAETDFYGGVYYIVGGSLFSANYQGEVSQVLLKGPAKSDGLKNLAIREAGDYRTLIVRTDSDQRFLYVFGRNKVVDLVTAGLRGIPYFANGFIAYGNDQGMLFVYDIEQGVKNFIFQQNGDSLSGGFEVIGWYANDNYILLRDESGSVYVCALNTAKLQLIRSEFAGEMVRSKGYTLYFYDEKALESLYFEDAMRNAKGE